MNRQQPYVLLITGTCGSGKTTVTKLIAERTGWLRVCEDDLWLERFGKNRGATCSDEHRARRRQIHDIVFADCFAALRAGKNVVIDATVHESPPEAYHEYAEVFHAHGIPWTLRVLHPRADVAVSRDATRSSWHVGAVGVLELRGKFTGGVFETGSYLDNSDDTPEQTVDRLLETPAARANR